MNQQADSQGQWTIIRLLRWTTQYLQAHHIESPRASAEILLAHVLGIQRIDLYLKYDQPLLDAELAAFKASIKRRVKNEPVSYIIGTREFWSLDFFVTSDVLIPRPETEFVVEETLKIEASMDVGRPLRILDVGTGSGAIIVSLAHEKPGHIYFASDRSRKALTVAKKNAVHHGVGEQIRFFCGDWCAPVTKKPFFDAILSNPPYIRTGDIASLQPEIAIYEPMWALDGDKDGMKCIRHLIRTAPDCLLSGGYLIMEIGCDQGGAVEKVASEAGCFESCEIIKDYSGHDRIVRLRKQGTKRPVP